MFSFHYQSILKLEKPRYLLERDGLYFAVIPVPTRLQGLLKRKQIWRSLKTKSYSKAVVNLKIEAGVAMSFFEMWADHEGKEALAERHFEDIAMRCMVQLLRDDQEQRVKFSEAPNCNDLLLKQKEQDLLQLELHKKALSKGDYKVVSDVTGKFLARSGLVWDDRNAVYKNLCMEVLKKFVIGYDKILKRYDNIWEEDYSTLYPKPESFNSQLNRAIKEYKNQLSSLKNRKEKEVDEAHISKALEKFTNALPYNATTKKRTITLGKLIELFNQSPEIKQKSSETRSKYSAFQRLLLDYFGNDIDTSEIDRQKYRNLLPVLKQIPKNLYKLKEFQGQPIDKIIKKTTEAGTYELLSAPTVNDYLEHLQTLLKWAKRENYTVTDDFSDIRAKRESKAKDAKLPFSKEMINQIITSKDIQQSRDSNDKTLYWITVIAFITGMRLGEICQLKLSDIRTQDSIDYISINTESSKSVKTEQSIRDVPINDLLKKAGFIEYIKSLRKTYQVSSSIFPHYTFGVKRVGDPITKRFSRLLIKLGIKNKKHTFHSTRHNYRDFIRESDLAKIENDLALEAGGWLVDSRSVHSNYGSGTSLKKKLATLNKIKYGILENLL